MKRGWCNNIACRVTEPPWITTWGIPSPRLPEAYHQNTTEGLGLKCPSDDPSEACNLPLHSAKNVTHSLPDITLNLTKGLGVRRASSLTQQDRNQFLCEQECYSGSRARCEILFETGTTFNLGALTFQSCLILSFDNTHTYCKFNKFYLLLQQMHLSN